jgi:uncharacterized protein (TIGR00661 family)
MGHAVRSAVILDYLVQAKHDVLIVVSGRAHAFLSRRFEGEPRVRIEKIHGLHLAYDGNALDLRHSVSENLEEVPRGLIVNSEVYRRVEAAGFAPQVVISDFEQWSYFYGRRHRIPVISIDNMKVMHRCWHEPEVFAGAEFDFRIARLAVRAKLAWAYYYLIATFFFPRIRKPQTTLVPPILRPEILALKREPGDHVLVYRTAATDHTLVPLLKTLPDQEFRVYGMGQEGQEGNVRLCAFSETGFLEDLRTARALLAGGGFTLMGEAVHLGVPTFSVPLEGQFEQEMNARYLQKLGYGRYARHLDAGVLREFLESLPRYENALATYPRQGNAYFFRCVEELLDRVARGEPAPVSLSRAAILHCAAVAPGSGHCGSPDASHSA